MGIRIDRVVVLRSYPPEADCLPDQSSNALCLHLLHDLGAIALHRSHTDVKLGRDGMVGASLHHQIEDFDLARRLLSLFGRGAARAPVHAGGFVVRVTITRAFARRLRSLCDLDLRVMNSGRQHQRLNRYLPRRGLML